jgi:hypothetical protein
MSEDRIDPGIEDIRDGIVARTEETDYVYYEHDREEPHVMWCRAEFYGDPDPGEVLMQVLYVISAFGVVYTEPYVPDGECVHDDVPAVRFGIEM